ncbi:MAG: hypothetical protein C9356_13980 [Oleiphilus sp.]|nr:MAG: hypothetical protein C9356_13980 [Oleiphilus sp.]
MLQSTIGVRYVRGRDLPACFGIASKLFVTLTVLRYFPTGQVVVFLSHSGDSVLSKSLQYLSAGMLNRLLNHYWNAVILMAGRQAVLVR